MMVHLRQRLYGLRDRLLTGPLILISVGVGLAIAMPELDEAVGGEAVPQNLRTTIDGGRAVLTAIASGLITSVTLLLSLVLVAVQLASTQFSPRIVRDWTGDPNQQVAIGLVLGTSVYCLLVLRETRTIGDEAAVPHLSVLLAVVLGVGSLLAVLRAVDALTKRLRVESIVRSIGERTLALAALRQPGEGSGSIDAHDVDLPLDALLVTATDWGWVQRIDESEILRAMPAGTTARLRVGVGSFVAPDTPVAAVWPAPTDDGCSDAIRRSIGIGEERTMQQDLGFGVTQLVDVALRALSPGVNDPNTASDIARNLGVILLRVWERPETGARRVEGDRSLLRHTIDREDLLESAFGPLRRHGAGDASVVTTMLETLAMVRAETIRRGLPGPIQPLERAMEAIVEEFERGEPSPTDRRLVATWRSAS